MKMHLTFVTFAFVLAGLTHAQQISTASRTEDLNYVVNIVAKADKFFFATLDPTQFQQAAAALTAKVPTATDAEFYVGLAQLVAMAGDMHTQIFLGTGNTPFLQFPLDLRWLDDGVFVVGAGSAYLNTLGTQIVAVEGMPVSQVVHQLGTTFAHSNDQYLHVEAESYLASQAILQALHIAPDAPTTAFTFQTLTGTQFTLQLAPRGSAGIAMLDPPLAQGPWPDYLNYGNYYTGVLSNSFFYSAPNKMLYAKYNTCEDLPGAPVSAFDAGVLAALDANPVDTLVIDFRGNGGGDEYLLFPLGLGLFERLPALVANPNFRLYLAIDKGTFSSGMYDPMAFVSGFLTNYEKLPPADTNGVFFVIGEPTSGKPVGYGDTVAFTLPGSGGTGQYSTDAVNQDNGVIPNLPSFNPDIPISTRSTDWFARFDPVMAAILARSSGPPAPPSGTAITVNAASFRTDQGVAPGSFAAVFGAFGQTPDQVLVGGVAGKIVSAAATQVNFIVPASAVPGATPISVLAGGAQLASGQFTVSAAGPGIFVLDGTNPQQPGAVENQDSTVNSTGNRAKVGSAIQIFATGYGPLDSKGSAPVRVFLGDLSAQVLYSGPAPGLPGLWQINALIPQGTPTGQLPLFLSAGNLTSNGVTIWIQ
ncbi:conserved exported hypothetical protein [Candidatus Sulfopaludibacter sp. SbA3]|nr:conserved exported hypothetical protein [Candidatus Sulfopaludibacter sp. SbA3]